MSKQLHNLEDELGQKLFERSNYSIHLTPAGMLLKRRAEDLLDMAEKIKIEFATINEDISGDIHIGCAESASIKYFAKVAKSLQEVYPTICFNLYSGNFEDVYYRLDSGLLDFYITLQSVDVSKYNYILLPAEDIWRVLMRKNDPLSEKSHVNIEDLRKLPLIFFCEGLREEYLKWFKEKLGKIKIAATFNLVYNATIFVREELGYAITIDKLADTNQDSELCFRPLVPELKSELRFIWKKSQMFSTPAKLLLQKMHEIYSN